MSNKNQNQKHAQFEQQNAKQFIEQVFAKYEPGHDQLEIIIKDSKKSGIGHRLFMDMYNDRRLRLIMDEFSDNVIAETNEELDRLIDVLSHFRGKIGKNNTLTSDEFLGLKAKQH